MAIGTGTGYDFTSLQRRDELILPRNLRRVIPASTSILSGCFSSSMSEVWHIKQSLLSIMTQ